MQKYNEKIGIKSINPSKIHEGCEKILLEVANFLNKPIIEIDLELQRSIQKDECHPLYEYVRTNKLRVNTLSPVIRVMAYHKYFVNVIDTSIESQALELMARLQVSYQKLSLDEKKDFIKDVENLLINFLNIIS